MRGAAHVLAFRRMGPSVPDAEGRGQAVVQGPSVTTRGRLVALSAKEVEVARQLVSEAAAVAHVDLGTTVGAEVVDDHCQVEREGAPVPLDGWWDVAAVIATPAYLRLLLRRPEAR